MCVRLNAASAKEKILLRVGKTISAHVLGLMGKRLEQFYAAMRHPQNTKATVPKNFFENAT
jgi:hypothetical protein